MRIDVKSLDWISVRFNEAEAVRRAAVLEARSEKWREALRSKNMPRSAYPLVASLLNESGAYREWDSVFRKHGLTVKVAGVEKVIMEPFSKSGAKCPGGANCNHLLVPCDALVQMNIYPVAP